MKIDKKSELLKKQLEPFFEDRREVNFAYLFGSSAEGSETLLSDIDIAVSVEKSMLEERNYSYGYAAHLTALLMQLLKTNRVDVAILEEAPPALKYVVFSRGLLLFRRDRDQEMKAFVKAFHEYQDTAPLRRIQQFYLQKYLKNLGSFSDRGRSS
jgi:predicted nucleotidyltransferase